MRRQPGHRFRIVGGAVVVVLLVLAGCSSDTGTIESPGTTGGGNVRPAGGPFDPGSVMATVADRGKLIVGTKFDQPGFGLKDPTTGKVQGFDVEVAKLVALAIFGGTPEAVEGRIEFVETVSKNREPYIQTDRVDMVVATYTINDARKQVIDFAGPYFVAQQDIMVKADDDSIKGVDDLNGKSVCTVLGSTSEKNLRAKAPRANVVLFDVYSTCAEALADGRVAAVTTDSPILAGLVKARGSAFELVKNPFSDEPYGIGVKKGATEWRAFINDQLDAMFASGEWKAAFEASLGQIGLDTPEPPSVDRYP